MINFLDTTNLNYFIKAIQDMLLIFHSLLTRTTFRDLILQIVEVCVLVSKYGTMLANQNRNNSSFFDDMFKSDQKQCISAQYLMNILSTITIRDTIQTVLEST